jgi:TolB-like protein
MAARERTFATPKPTPVANLESIRDHSGRIAGILNMTESEGEEKAAAGAAPAPPAAARARSDTPDAFISYASQDAAIATAVVEALERHGVTCWIAPRDAMPGELYADAIVGAINVTRVLVLVLTENAAASPHVLREIERASAKRHPVVSFRIDGASLPPGLEYFLSASHWLDAKNSGIDTALPKLVEAVKRLTADAVKQFSNSVNAAKSVSVLFPHLPEGVRAGQRLNRPVVVLGVLIAGVVAYLVVDKLWLSKHATPERSVAAATPAAVPAAVGVPEKSVAVLPFVDMSEKKDQEYFSDGLSEELIDMLTKVPNLRVPARTSSFYFKGKQTTIAEIAKSLGVAHVLEGSVRKSGENLRITAQLIRADNGYHIWSETYDRKLDDIFRIQDEIAGRVLISLKAALDRSSRSTAVPTKNAQAYTLLLQGRALEERASTRAEYENAISYLQRAITADPTSAVAWEALSAARKDEFIDGFLEYNVASDEARTAAERALALDPQEGGAHRAMAAVYFVFDWDWGAAAREFKTAYELKPAAGTGRLLADVEFALGTNDAQVLQLYQNAVEQDPVNALNYGRLADYFLCTGRLAEAEAAARRAYDLNPAQWQHELGEVLLFRGNAVDALTQFQRMSSGGSRLHGLALAYQALGRRAEADSTLKAYEAEAARTDPARIAEVRAYRKEIDQAFAWLDRAWRIRDPSALSVKRTPLLANIRGDPRYKAFLRKMNLPE